VRALFLIAAFVMLATIAPLPPPGPPPGPGIGIVRAEPIPFSEDEPGLRRVGALTFLRGWHLTSDQGRFGAISAMHVDSGEVIALNDAGMVLEFPLPRVAGEGRLRLIPIAGPGSPLDKRNRDTEALAVSGGTAWVAFERHNRVWRYRRPGWQAEAAGRPAAIRGWRRNSGAETMVRLGDGRFLIIAEGPSGEAHSEAALFDGDPAEAGTPAVTLRYRRPPGYRPTDAALLPDGRLLILNRKVSLLSGFSSKLVVAEIRALREGAVIEGREIAEFALDNMEALSVAREGGRTIVRIASDDNFMPMLQRTLLVEFALDEREVRRPRPRFASSPARASGGEPSG
jgi:hypothetical protein